MVDLWSWNLFVTLQAESHYFLREHPSLQNSVYSSRLLRVPSGRNLWSTETLLDLNPKIRCLQCLDCFWLRRPLLQAHWMCCSLWTPPSIQARYQLYWFERWTTLLVEATYMLPIFFRWKEISHNLVESLWWHISAIQIFYPSVGRAKGLNHTPRANDEVLPSIFSSQSCAHVVLCKRSSKVFARPMVCCLTTPARFMEWNVPSMENTPDTLRVPSKVYSALVDDSHCPTLQRRPTSLIRFESPRQLSSRQEMHSIQRSWKSP